MELVDCDAELLSYHTEWNKVEKSSSYRIRDLLFRVILSKVTG